MSEMPNKLPKCSHPFCLGRVGFIHTFIMYDPDNQMYSSNIDLHHECAGLHLIAFPGTRLEFPVK